MPGIATHLVVRAVDSRVLTPTVGTRRRLARALVRVGDPYRLLAFGAADTHVHILLLGAEQPAAGVHALALALRAAVGLPVPLDRTRTTLVVDQGHLSRTFLYVLGQAAHHGVAFDPFREATSLPELLGLRPGGEGLIRRVRAALPRLGRAHLLDSLGVAALEPDLLLDHVLDAGCAAAGVDRFDGRSARVVAARHAALALLAPRIGAAAAAAVLGVDPRSARRARATPADPEWTRAVGLQMGLRSAWAAANLRRSPAPPA